MKAVVEGSEEEGFLPNGPIDKDLLMFLIDDMAPLATAQQARVVDSSLTTSVGSRASILLELSGIKVAIRTWYAKQPDQVLREASAYSARLTEMWTDLRLLEDNDRQYRQLRTMQVQPVLDEIDRQYRFSSSRIAIARQDIDLIRGT